MCHVYLLMATSLQVSRSVIISYGLRESSVLALCFQFLGLFWSVMFRSQIVPPYKFSLIVQVIIPRCRAEVEADLHRKVLTETRRAKETSLSLPKGFLSLGSVRR